MLDINALIQTIAIAALPVVFAITLHEAAHGYAARHFGDPTAWQAELKLHAELFTTLAYHLPAELTATKQKMQAALSA